MGHSLQANTLSTYHSLDHHHQHSDSSHTPAQTQMRSLIPSIVCLALVASTVLASASSPAPEIDDEYQKVTCGSSVKLTHEKSQFKLHSHAIPYGTGSGQQSITAVPNKDDTNSLWTVMAQLGHTCERGEPVPCGSVIRLKHVNTKKFLHSHQHQSPMSGGREVSAYDGQDDGDNWTVQCQSSKDAFWARETPVHLVHTNSGLYLATSTRHVYGNPIPGQQEVAAHGAHVANEQRWMAQEGVYFAEKEEL